MSTKHWARILVGMAAAAAVAGSILVPTTPPPAVAQPSITPEALVDPTGEIPCLDASRAEFVSLGCRARIISNFLVPDELVAPIITSGRAHSCDPNPISPATKVITVDAAVGVSATQTTSTEQNGATWEAHGTTVTATSHAAPGGVGKSVAWSYHYTKTEVSGWSTSMSDALGSTYTMSESHQVRVAPFHWAFMTFTPKIRQIDLLWTWTDPALSAERPGFRSSAVQTTQFPEFRDGIPAGGSQQVASEVLLGDWDAIEVPMSPAEIDACSTPDGPKKPTFNQPDLLPPSGTAYLDSMPFMYTVSPPVAPVLRNRAGTGARLVDAQLVIANGPSGPTFDAPLGHSIQLTGGAEAGVWTASGCTAFSARIGYGESLLSVQPGDARDTLELWAGRIVNGLVQPERLVSQSLVPVPSGHASGREHFQAEVSADITGAEVLILKVVTGPGNRDSMSTRTPGVILAEPRIVCGSSSISSAFQTSAYVDPIETVEVDLAGTPAEVAADPVRFMQPSDVRYGWDCVNDPRNPVGVMPRTTVNLACGGAPLTVWGQQYDSGIGLHSGGDPGAGVVWDRTPNVCTTLTFGVGFDDHPGFPRHDHTVTVFSSLHDPRDGKLNAPVQLGSPIHINGDGRSGVQWFSYDKLGSGAQRIEIRIATASNGNGHVDIIKPTLTCKSQGSGTSTTTAPPPSGAAVGQYAVSQMEWVRDSNHWGPVERDASLGEQPAGDGRPVQADDGRPLMSIGGVSGWSSGLGMAPSHWTPEALVEVRTAARCERVTAWVGIDDEVGNNGSVTFKVYADGVLVEESPVKRGGERPTFLSADVTGALLVTLAVAKADNSNRYDHADWAEPTLYCSSSPTSAHVREVANIAWASEWNGWGPAERNLSLGEQYPRDGRAMAIGGSHGWSTGIGVAPATGQPARIVVAPGDGCTAFTSWVGIDDEVEGNGSVQFMVVVNRNGHSEQHTVGIKRGWEQPSLLKVDVSGADSIELVALDGGNGNAYDHADWANPTLYCG